MEALVSRYRNEAERSKKEAEEAKIELEEFMSYSRAMEAELDEELSGEKLKNSKLEKELSSLRHQFDKYKEEITRSRAESYSLDLKRTEELKSLRAENENLSRRVRELEQKNDDLERELRIRNETLKDTEKRLNDELELRALLSTDLLLKEELGEHCQRLEDEIRDLRVDNNVKETKLRNWRTLDRTSLSPCSEEVKEMQNGVSRPSSVKIAKLSCDVEHGINGTTFSPLSSPLARNITPVIANLLKTVQGLEKKLLSMHPDRTSSCETCLSSLNRR